MVLQHAVNHAVRSQAVHDPLPTLSAHHARDDAHWPDPVRITGIAGALVLNAAALMLMLAPLGQPELPARRPAAIQGEWFEPRPLPPPPPPEIVPLQPRAAAPTAAAPPRQASAPAPVQRVAPTADPASTPVEIPSQEPATDTTTTASGRATGPVNGMQLAYAEASLPPYPPAALRAGHQGTVVLKVLVDADGRPLRVEVDAGSGYRELDEAARRHVLRRWRFQPAMRDGRPTQAIGLVPITFNLDRS